jgi:hypothetical protein
MTDRGGMNIPALWRLAAAMSLLLGVLAATAPPAGATAWSAAPRAGWFPPSGTVYAIARAGGVVYLGGTFTTMRNSTTGQTVTRKRLAALDASTGRLLPWSPGATNAVRALTVAPNGTILAGGAFISAAGKPASRLVAITPQGTAVPGWRGSADGVVRDLRIRGNDLFVAGDFTVVGGINRRGVARLDLATGQVERGFDARVRNGKVWALATNGSRLYLGGTFTKLRRSARARIGAVDPDNGALLSWTGQAPCPTCPVLDVALAGDSVLAGVGGNGGGAVSWSATTGRLRWNRRADGDVQAVAVVDDNKVVFGGHFGPSSTAAFATSSP